LSGGGDLSWLDVEQSDSKSAAALIAKARMLLISTAVLWSMSFPLLRGLELTQRATVTGVSDAALASADMTWREWSQAIGLAVFAGAGLYLQTLGLAWTDASVAAFLTQLYTLIVPLIVAVRDRQLPTRRVVVACVLVLAGAAILSPNLFRYFTLGPGELVIVASTFFMACQIVWVERPIYAENRPGVVTLIMFAFMAVMFGGSYLSAGGTTTTATQLFATPVLATLTLALVLLCTVFNFLVMNAWQRCVSATEAGIIYCIEPVLATVFSAFMPGLISRVATIAYANESLTWSLLVGGALIIAATVLVATEKRTV
jgi:drug/metabolite transporter (DMT)-like permease